MSPIPPAGGSCSRFRTSRRCSTTGASCSSDQTASSTSPSATVERVEATANPRGRCSASCCGSTPPGRCPGSTRSPSIIRSRGATPGADEIYSYGLRNPYRFSFDRLTGDLTIGDVGQASREEIDFAASGAGNGANFGWNCFEGSQPYAGGCTPPPANHTPPVLEYPHPDTGSAAVNGGYVIRDGALPSLLGRYIYADTYDVFGSELRTAKLFPGGSSGDSGLGLFATTVVSFGEDACAHIYVASFGGAVYRLEPNSGPFPCIPQIPPPLPPPASAAAPASGFDQKAAIRKCKKKHPKGTEK